MGSFREMSSGLLLLEHSSIMANFLWKSMLAALKKPTLDELYKRVRELDYSLMDERMVVMLNAILELESKGQGGESAREKVLMVGYS